MQPTINPAVQSVLIVLKNLRHHHLRSGRLAFLLFGVFGFLCFVLLFLLLFLFLLLVLFTFVFAFRTTSLCCLILRFPWHFCGPLNEQVEQTPGCWFLRLHMNHQDPKEAWWWNLMSGDKQFNMKLHRSTLLQMKSVDTKKKETNFSDILGLWAFPSIVFSWISKHPTNSFSSGIGCQQKFILGLHYE